MKRTDYCGRIDRRYLGQTVALTGWVHRRRDHGGVIFIDLRDREGLVQVVCDPDRAATFATAETLRHEFCIAVTGVVRPRPEGTVNTDAPVRRNRGARAFDRDPQRVAHAAVPDGRREPVRDRSPRESDAGPAPPADAEEPDAAPPRRDGRAQVPGRPRLRRHRDADPLQVHAGRRARVPRAVAHQPRPFLRAAAVAAIVQADADDVGVRPLLPDREMLPRRGPARRPAARIHADRHRDVVHGRGRDLRADGIAGPRDVEGGAGRRPAGPVPGDDVRGRHGEIRLGQARPARVAGADRIDRPHAHRRLQGVPRRGGSGRTAASPRCAFPAAAP